MHRISIVQFWARLSVAAAIALPSIGFCAAAKDWTTLENCQLVPNPANDGDSFHIRVNDTEYLLRLYLVDAPETKGGLMADRLIEQANYFGLSVPQVIEIGEKAKLFVEAKLAAPFTAQTRMASGLGRSKIERFYAFVQTKDGDLGQLLVANGLARVHGTRAARPGARSATEEIEKLGQLEQEAKQAKVGGWSANVGATAHAPEPIRTVNPVVSTLQPSPKPSPLMLVPSRSPNRTGPATPLPAAADAGKLDINTATKEELEKIPGIGESISERIIAARPFRSADELKNVAGIGSGKRYEQIRAFFR